MGRRDQDWYFISEARRDEYLARAVARGRQVKRATVHGGVQHRFIADRPLGMTADNDIYHAKLYTVVEIDRRKGI